MDQRLKDRELNIRFAAGPTPGRIQQMSMTKEQVRSAALQLDPSDREALAEELLLSIDAEQASAIDAAWLDEVRRRDEAFIAGRTSAKPASEVIERLNARARQ
jgi:putative addiction module component (TIGR02574 family)